MYFVFLHWQTCLYFKQEEEKNCQRSILFKLLLISYAVLLLNEMYLVLRLVRYFSWKIRHFVYYLVQRQQYGCTLLLCSTSTFRPTSPRPAQYPQYLHVVRRYPHCNLRFRTCHSVTAEQRKKEKKENTRQGLFCKPAILTHTKTALIQALC